MIRLCFVCLGNICRSPTAEGVMRRLVEEAGLAGEIQVDSAGTGTWHLGEPPDPRATAAAARRGIRLGGTARRVGRDDLDRFDLVLAMDRSNLDALRRIAGTAEERAKLRLLRDFEPGAPPGSEVPDPYFGGGDGFEKVIDICDAACRGLLDHVRREHGL